MNGQQNKNVIESKSALSVNPLTGTEKRCTRCGEIKPINEFYKGILYKDGYFSKCIVCITKINKEWCLNNRERRREQQKKRNLIHPEKAKGRQIKYKKIGQQKSREFYLRNREKIIAKSKAWHLVYPERAKELHRKTIAKIRSTTKGKLNGNMAVGIGASLKGLKAGKRWETLVGFTVYQLKKHLEKQFTSEMAWGNYGQNGWVIDHIIPISVFNFENPEDIDFKRCWALKNLQPMWFKENSIKSNKLKENINK